ncbi:MAG: FAD-dependent oxidoreductase, partial [Chloroflexi bacterium]|nr:FAD-dependent oxidoreductase [Chloroflexota bacterium]
EGQRAILARPLADRLIFAGEAVSIHRAATVHGALETGFRAADLILQR